MIRVLLPVADPKPASIQVEGERFHYLVHVLRVRAGQALEVFDGKGRAFSATVEALGEESAALKLGEERRERPQRQTFVVQGLPKGDKLEWIIEKATELGAAGVLPVATERAVVKLDAERAEKKRERWQKIADEAARQCGRADVPAVLSVRPLAKVREALPPGTRLLVLDEEETALRLGAALPGPGVPVALIVGPEGGLSRAEVQAARQAGAQSVSLGRNILRTETAALAALSVIRHRDGDLG